jgi:LacI family transcriptional regulator
MPKVTTMDIARAVGVSQSTVSFVLNGKTSAAISPGTREKVLLKAEELGYNFKKWNRAEAEKTVTIAVLVPTLSNIYYPFLLQNIEFYAKENGITCLIINTIRGEQIENYYNYIRLNPIDGLLYLYAPEIKIPINIPAVIIGEKDPRQAVNTVSLNSVMAGRILAKHLVDMGHNKIAYLTSPLNRTTLARKNRLEGIRGFMKESGFDNNLKVYEEKNEVEEMSIAYDYQCGRILADKLLKRYKNVTAIIGVNDMTAVGALSMLYEKGLRIPDDMAVAGFDNTLFSTVVTPQLTTVDQMAFHASKLGLDILLEKIKKRELDSRTINVEYEPNLIVRASTKKNISS